MCKAEDNNAVTACLFDTFYHQKTICNRMRNRAKCTSSVVNASVSIHLDKFIVCEEGRKKTREQLGNKFKSDSDILKKQELSKLTVFW